MRKLSPSLQYTPVTNGNGSSFNIRGIGTIGFAPLSSEPSAALVIDGVVQGIAGQGIGELSDIERVEVLRGPQGMLFGKNASTGLINVVTKMPSLAGFEANGSLSYASLDELKARLSVNLPLTDTMAVRVSGFHSERDGILKNPVQGRDYNDLDTQGGRFKFLWQPTDDVTFNFIGDYSETSQYCCVYTVRDAVPGSRLSDDLAQWGVTPGKSNKKSIAGFPTRQDQESYGLQGQLEWEVGDVTVTAISAYRRYDMDFQQDLDLGTAEALHQFPVGTQEARQVSHELRFSSLHGNLVDYVVGLYYFDKDVDQPSLIGGTFNIPPFIRPSPALSAPDGIVDFSFGNRSYAAFGQVDLNVTDELTFILGARYTEDEIELRTVNTLAPGFIGMPPFWQQNIAPPAGGKADFDNWSWRIGARYQFTYDLMGYITLSRGYKGPAPLEDTATSITLSDPEIPTNLELGLKSTWLDGRWMVNVALFDQEVKDFQAQVFDFTLNPPGVRLTNAGMLKSRGVELETQFAATDYLTLSASLTYQDAYFDKFVGASCYAGQTAAQGCITTPTGASYYDASGRPLPNAPEWVYTINADYVQPLGNNLELFGNLNWYWRDEATFTVAPNPNTVQDAYGLLGASIGIGSADQRWRVTLFGRNLLDEEFAANIGEAVMGAPGETQQLFTADSRRTVGVELSFSYGR